MSEAAHSSAGARDVLCILNEASAQLRVGELLAPDSFSLGAVMNATEIGNPRLDAGAGRENQPSPEVTAPADLSASQVTAVMDQLAAMEATWHAGLPLAQTLYTCHYLVNTHRISHLVSLKAFCIGMKVTTRMISDLAFTTRVCNEEDLLPYLFGFTETQGLSDVPRALSELETAEERLLALRRASKLPASSNVDEITFAEAALSRLRFRKHLLQALLKFSGGSKQQLEAARRPLLSAQAELARVIATAEAAAGEAPGFDPDMNRHLLGPAPPRAVQPASKAATWEYYTKLLQQLMLVCDVTKVSRWSELKEFMEGFAAQWPTPVARLVMAQSLEPHPGAPAAMQCWMPQPPMMRASLGLPKPGTQLSCPAADYFVEQVVIMAGTWVRCKCLNRARQRRRHRRAIEDWANLHQHARNAEASAALQAWLAAAQWDYKPMRAGEQQLQGPLSGWVEKECCRELLQHLLLGFELNCYLPSEFCMIYWYCDYLYGWAYENARVLAAWLPMVGGHGLKAKRAAKGNADQALLLEAQALQHEANKSLAERKLCQSAMRCGAALLVAGMLKPRPAPFNSEEQYFEQRFFVFTHLASPTPLAYADYVHAMEKTLADCSPQELLLSAAASCNEARSVAYHMSQKLSQENKASLLVEAQLLERLARQNLVAISLLTRALEQRGPGKERDPELAVTWDFTRHKFFPVLNLKSLAGPQGA